MGRLKSTSKVKSNVPIPLPHDGIIYHHAVNLDFENHESYLQQSTHPRSTTPSSSFSLSVALRLLKDSTHTIDSKHVLSSSASICKELCEASTLQVQLQVLQTHRSQLLNKCKEQKQQQQEEKRIRTEENQPQGPLIPLSSNGRCEWIGLYRLLLEWSLSVQTTMPLRRAIQSNLSVYHNLHLNSELMLAVQEEVLMSFWDTPRVATGIEQFTPVSSSTTDDNPMCYWENVLYSMELAVNYAPTLQVLQENFMVDITSFLFQNWVAPFISKSSSKINSDSETALNDSTVSMVQDGLVVVAILKILLHPTKQVSNSAFSPELLAAAATSTTSDVDGTLSTKSGRTIIKPPRLTEFQTFLLHLLGSPNTPPEGHSILGVTYGRCMLLNSLDSTCCPSNVDDVARTAVATVRAISDERNIGEESHLTELNKSSLSGAIMYGNLSQLAKLAIVQGIAATLDGEDLLRKIPSPSILANGASHDASQEAFKSTNSAALSPLEACWTFTLETSRVATDPLVRFGTLKAISTLISRCHSLQFDLNEPHIKSLIEETLEMVLDAWENPPMRKLGTAIPSLFESMVQLLDDARVGELVNFILIEQPKYRKGRYIALETLLPRIGTQKILQHGGLEALLEGIGDRGGQNTGVIADLWAKVLLHIWNDLVVNDQSSCGDRKSWNSHNYDHNDPINGVFSKWLDEWIPSLSRALVSPDGFSRRKQVAAFCLPRMESLMKGSGDKILLTMIPAAVAALLDTIAHSRREQLELENDSTEEESFGDRITWALLEVIRQTAVNIRDSAKLTYAISSLVPIGRLRLACTHKAASLRLVAFQSLQPVVWSSCTPDTDILGIAKEAEIWRFAFRYAAKTTESREYTSSLLHCLFGFIDRFLIAESNLTQGSLGTEVPVLGNMPGLPKVTSFVKDFVIHDVIARKGAYPGAVHEKEGFCISLLEGILTFATQDQSHASDNSLTKNGVIFKRRRRKIEVDAMADVVGSLLSREVFAALFALLQSQWDSTRKNAFRFLTKLVSVAQTRNMPLPAEYSLKYRRIALLSRGIYLASSPRQRESDTGARMVAFLHISLTSGDDRANFMTELADLLELRIDCMKDKLAMLLSSGNDNAAESDASIDGSDLPLGHGIIQAIRLAIKSDSPSDIREDLYCRISILFCRALQVSLSVVADVKDGELLDGIIETGVSSTSRDQGSTPLNVNTGAIGANGLFSSVNMNGEGELRRRLAVQRVVVGSWLLTKEACAAIATVITADGFKAGHSVVQQVGVLLLSTLTSLKHAGGAFAAHNALQEIATACLSRKLVSGTLSLPSCWVKRLLDEMSVSDRVKNSTLRRSTGFALAFLSIMRSEALLRSGKSKLLASILANILRQSLPSRGSVRDAFDKLGMDGRKFFTYPMQKEWNSRFVADEEYEERSRVHALNVLRLIILDAPLSHVVSPFVGDAIVSSILGYIDPAWSVRNSSTMVFAAAMLRVVDADKNASNTDRTSNKAITITELNRRYPSLSGFLQSVMKTDLLTSSWSKLGDLGDSRVYPILLLLSRVQSVCQSGLKAAEQTEGFIPLVFQCLKNRNVSIRAAAARTIANLCSNDQRRISSVRSLLEKCFETLTWTDTDHPDFNAVHGSLLAIDGLTQSSPTGIQYILDSKHNVKLLEVVSWTGTALPAFPPCCMIPAITTLLRCIRLDNSGIFGCVQAACLNIVSRDLDTIGAAKLYATIGSSLCVIASPALWDINSCSETFNVQLSQMSAVLQSSSIDVRLAATKAFKKSIYSDVDSLLSTDATKPQKMDRLSAIGGMLLDVLHKEVNRDGFRNDQTHAPTLRRVSRCFLECCDGFKRIDAGARNYFQNSLPNACLVWEVSSMILRKEESSLDVFESNGETLLMANAAELMATDIAPRISKTRSGRSCPDLSSKLSHFARVVTRLNDPQASWRSRHSAAVAIENSHILTLETDDKSLQETRTLMLFETLRMLQDGDSDVRRVAARVTCSYGLSEEECITSSTLPQLILEYMLPSVLKKDSVSIKSGISRHLINLVIENCRTTPDSISLLLDERSHYRSESPTSIVNVATSRKIFEDEDPNPSYERALVNQLAMRAILQTPDIVLPLELCRELLTICHLCLERMWRWLEKDELGCELSWFPTLFPQLHSLILMSCVVIYSGAYGSEEVQGIANRIVTEKNQNSSAWWNPEIILALEVLGSVQNSDEKSLMSIFACCFLLKQ